jgi:gluconolactonase
VSEIGECNKDGDGKITVIGKSAAPKVFAKGLDDPKGLAARSGALFVSDKTRIWKIERGHASVFAKAGDFPHRPVFLNDLTFDRRGSLYVSDSGDIQNGGKGAIFKITPQGKVSLVISEAQNPSIKSPNGLLLEPTGKLLVIEARTGHGRLQPLVTAPEGVGRARQARSNAPHPELMPSSFASSCERRKPEALVTCEMR